MADSRMTESRIAGMSETLKMRSNDQVESGEFLDISWIKVPEW
jgi:hypothetical protein